jgi:trans-L-3-hydroxyproline dehydratase
MTLNWNQNDLTTGKRVVTSIDAHAAGEPLRVVLAGLPAIPGETMLAKRRWLRDHLDHLRRALIHEPRGHFDMYGAVVTPAVSAGADVGVLFLHNEGYSTMCGHGIIALVTVLLETGAVPARAAQTPVVLDTPAGPVQATGHIGPGGRVEKVAFRNVPSFVLRRDLELAVPSLGPLTVDIAFGGAFYAILPAARLGLRVTPAMLGPLVDAAARIKQAINRVALIEHPVEDDLGYLYGVIFTDGPEAAVHHSRNLCVFADRQVDRSPTGTGISARLAVHHARGEIGLGVPFAVESVLGRQSVFEGKVVETACVGPFEAVVTEVAGSAFITGRHEFLIDPNDPLADGFLL